MVYPRTVIHSSTNRARRRATTLIETNELPLGHAAAQERPVRQDVTSKFENDTVIRSQIVAHFIPELCEV